MKKGMIGVWILMMLCITAGCTEAQETLMQMRQELKQEIALEEMDNTQPGRTDDRENTLTVPSVDDMVKDDITIEETYEPVQTMSTPVQEITVALYFADAAGEKLVKTEKRIPKVEGMARSTIETLLEGPDADSGLVSAIPSGTQLLDINVKPEDKKCIVDFSQELMHQLASKDNGEQLAVYSVVNTLCQFDSIEQVEFRIEGQSVATLAGGMNLSKTVSANTAIVR